MILFKKVLKRISFSSIKKTQIIVFDKNYNGLLKKLIHKDFIVFNINTSKLYIKLLFSSALNFLFFSSKNVSFHEIYYKKYLKKINPEILITFEDTDHRILKLAQFFPKIKFIIIQNSYRPPGFYGKILLKKTDLLVTYSPLVKFNISSNEISMKTLKYFGGNNKSDLLKNKVILISQFRQFSNDEYIKSAKQYYPEVDNELFLLANPDFLYNQDLFLNFLSNYFSRSEKLFFYKSAHREQTSFQKIDEKKYFKKFNIVEFEVSNEDIFSSTSNDIYICIDSTMIFELISQNKKILIYPHRKFFRDSTCTPHIEILAKSFPDLIINEDFSDFKKKFNLLDKMSQKEYNSKYRIFNSMKEFNLKEYI